MNKLIEQGKRTLWKCKTILDSTKKGVDQNPISPGTWHDYNLVSSLATDGKHYPALDIDIPCRYVESSTEGHGHLYFDELGMSWEKYEVLLMALASAGIIDWRYAKHSVNRRMTLLRPPHIRKDDPDRQPAPK